VRSLTLIDAGVPQITDIHSPRESDPEYGNLAGVATDTKLAIRVGWTAPLIRANEPPRTANDGRRPGDTLEGRRNRIATKSSS
jgi:hypothetical protein